MLGGAFSSFMGQIACSVHAVWLLFVKGLLETARSFETVDPVVCEYHALDDALRHERLDHDERFKQQVVARNREACTTALVQGASNTGGPPSLPYNRDARR